MHELMGSEFSKVLMDSFSKFEGLKNILKGMIITVSLYVNVKQAVEAGLEEGWSKSADKRQKPLKELVELLIEKECHHDMAPDDEQEHPNTSTNKESKKSDVAEYKKSDVAPLLLATISNIEDIVEEFMREHPQKLGSTNKEGQFDNHNIDIFYMVIQAQIFEVSLSSAVDNNGKSILHMVGSREKSSQSSEKKQSPTFQLRKELKLFKEVKSACKTHLTKRLNNDNRTAEELFASKYEKLHGEAKEWLLRTTENCTILSVFIATVAFAAAYTVPGGPDQNTGIPILSSKPFFMIFIIADVISLTLALTSVGIFLSILTSSFALLDFETNLFRKLYWGMLSMIFSVSMMAVAFGATILLIWKDTPLSALGFLPVPIFFLSYTPLRSATIEWLKNLTVKVLAGVLVICLEVYLLAVPLYALLCLRDKAYEFIGSTPVGWICGCNSIVEPGTPDPEPTPTSAAQSDV